MGGGSPPLPYFCINCVYPAPQIYKDYANGNLIKLNNCKSCGELVDKYVEYDNIIIFLNLILLNPKAYRHLLLNGAFKGVWKLCVIALFVESYCFWCLQKQGERQDQVQDFYELEINFYTALLRTFLAFFVFQSLVLISSYVLRPRISPVVNPLSSSTSLDRKRGSTTSVGGGGKRKTSFQYSPESVFSYISVWKGLCLCGFAQVFKLVALIWSYTDDFRRIGIVDILFVASNMMAYHVTTGVSRPISLTVVMISFIAMKYAIYLYDENVKL